MSIITCDQYRIEQRPENGQTLYVLHQGDSFLASAPELDYVLNVMFEDFSASRQHTLSRVNQPEIKITMTIR